MRTAALPSPRRIAVRSTGTDIRNINGGESLVLEYSRWNHHAPCADACADPHLLGDQTSTGPVRVVVATGK